MLSLRGPPPAGRCDELAEWSQNDESDPATGCRECVIRLDFLAQCWAVQWRPPGVRAFPAPAERPLPLLRASWLDRSRSHPVPELGQCGRSGNSGWRWARSVEIRQIRKKFDPGFDSFLNGFVLVPLADCARTVCLVAGYDAEADPCLWAFPTKMRSEAANPARWCSSHSEGGANSVRRAGNMLLNDA